MSALHFPKYGEPVAQAHMRQALKQRNAPAEAPAWDSLPISVRRTFAQKALGITGVYVGEKTWADLKPQERIKIGAAARSIANALL